MGRVNAKMYSILAFVSCSLTGIICWMNWSQTYDFLPLHSYRKFGGWNFSNRTTSDSNISLEPYEDESSIPKGTGPSSLMEQTRRHIHLTARDQWLFMKTQIETLQRLIDDHNVRKKSMNIKKYKSILKLMLDHGADFRRVIDIELLKLARVDGWNEWRKSETKDLNEIVHSRLAKLQNPKDCSKAPVLICNLTNPYGFASGVHDVLWCFVKAYKEQRRLVLITTHWHYAPGGWNTLFQPLSDTCTDENFTLEDKISPWPGDNNNRARWLLRTLPKDLGPRILRLYENPLAWWYGQFLKYLMRPNHRLKTALNRVFQDLNFTKGVIGIHVRRTDKVGSEAVEHQLGEYMNHVEEHFQDIELLSEQRIERRVYIATDDPTVIQECKLRFSNYDCLYNPGSAEVASNLETRYSNSSLWSLVIDILALSKSDFIVCTLSSGVCRLAYELKVATDESFVMNPNQIISLDVPHHYAWVIPASHKAMYNHISRSPKEMAFQKGDILIYKDEYCTVNAAVRGKTTNGLIKLINSKNHNQGFVPVYKTREMFQLNNFSL